jgi:3-dehydroquinate dehydratase type I
MVLPEAVKGLSPAPRSVGVIFSQADLHRACRSQQPPDLFELRLDAFADVIDDLERAIPKLSAPLLITARARVEGGANNLSLARRRQLLLRFLPMARYLDVELRFALALSDVIKRARKAKIGVILSLHVLNTTPSQRVLFLAAIRARSLGADIFKIATLTDRRDQVDRLLNLLKWQGAPVPVSAMGFGKLGRESRASLIRAGSVLNYAYLAKPSVEGQWSLAQLRAVLKEKG